MPIQFSRNRNGFAVAKVHYSADPEKDAAWVEREKKGMPEWAWRKEMEMDPSAASGKLVFPELVRWAQHLYVPLHKVVVDAYIPEWWPRYAGFDWGRTNPSAIELCAISPQGTIIFYWEMYREDLKPQEIDAIMKSHPDWERILFVGHDPSMLNMTGFGGGVRSGSGDEEKALAHIFHEMGWPLVPGIRGDDVTFTQELYRAWTDLTNPKIIITHACPNLWHELNNLRHEELNTISINKKNDPERIVPKANHAFHAIKYLLRLNPSPPSLEENRSYLTNDERARLPHRPAKVYDDVLGEYA